MIHCLLLLLLWSPAYATTRRQPVRRQPASHSRRNNRAWGLERRGIACVRHYEAALPSRQHYPKLLELTGRLQPTTEMLERKVNGSSPRAVAMLFGGQSFRGHAREVASNSRATSDTGLSKRWHAQVRASNSMVEQVIVPFEKSGRRVDVFLTVYDTVKTQLRAELVSLYSPRVVSVTTVNEAGSQQLVRLAESVRIFLEQCASRGLVYETIIVTRYDLYIKQPLMRLVERNGSSVDSFRFLWREGNGHWRHHSNMRAVVGTFRTDAGFDWRTSNQRAPDALIALPFDYTACFRSAVRYITLPPKTAPNTSNLIHFLHNMIPELRNNVASRGPSEPPAVRFMFDDVSADSNPCRATCMSNPVYDILPRAEWVVASNICQRDADFVYDPISASRCCPTPNYCCPNSVVDCSLPEATLFDVFKSETPRSQILYSWPRSQGTTYRWWMTPESKRYVSEVWMNATTDESSKAKSLCVDPANATKRVCSKHYIASLARMVAATRLNADALVAAASSSASQR